MRKGAILIALEAAALLAACSPPPSSPFPEKDRAAEAKRLLTGPDWYRHAVFYEVYVRSFQDSTGDGIGDLPGLTARLPYLQELGVDALWLMPIMPSPFADSGYDIANYRDINPEYGTLHDFDALLAEAHRLGLRVFVDLVLNHTSDQHPWFLESRSSRDNTKADWYVWSDKAGRDDIGCGTVPTFGTQAWTFVPERGQYYFHRFYPNQPDLNYRNPRVVEETLDIARFWLERGVDGFRCDVLGLLYESATACDLIPETADYIRKLRKLLDSYPDRALVAENFDLDSAASYFGDGHDMAHMAFNFIFGFAWWAMLDKPTPELLVDRIKHTQATYPAGAQDALFIGTHDFPRAYERTKGNESRWRRGALLQLTLPATPFIYYGEELALRPGTQIVVDQRDTARTPMIWSGAPGHGFTTGKPWIELGAEADLTSLESEKADPTSTYWFYRQLLALRRGREALSTGALSFLATDQPPLLVYTRAASSETYLVAVSLDEQHELSAAIPELQLPAEPPRLLGDARLTREAAGARLTVPPGGMGIFRVR
jgi:alpha-glucosidase